MKVCSNCNTHLSCSCQRRVASDGTLCCDNCVEIHERKLIQPTPSPAPAVKKEPIKVSIKTIDTEE